MKRTNSWLATILSSLLVSVLALPVLAQRAPEIPSGTSIQVRMIDKLSSEENQAGDVFAGTLEDPIIVNGKELYPKGADVRGRVADVHRSGRLSEPGELDLVLNTVTSGRVIVSLHVQPLVIKGESHAKSNATKIGGGAALGAVIGAIAGGGKGAAIGAGVGGAAGTGAAAATGKKPATVDSEAVLTFVTVSASGGAGENAGSPANRTDNADLPASSSADEALFTLRDRRIIRTCVGEHAADFPQGTTQRPELPSGEERKLERGATLPSDVQGKAQSLPLACVQQLPPLPKDQDRVVYNGRVLLIDSNSRILDMFYLDQNQ
jgi:outer membrane lipoprotein SlyB